MNNKKIKNAIACSVDGVLFKSKLERLIYLNLKELGFKPQYEPTTFTLWFGGNSKTPFYDEESKSQRDRRIKKGDNELSKMLIRKPDKMVDIKYTPDFYLKYKNLDVYIEVKSIENDVYYIKKKLFRKYLDNFLIHSGRHSIFFEVHSKKQLLQAVDIFTQYAKEIR